MKRIFFLSAALPLGLTLNASGALVALPVPNHSFEQDAHADGSATATITGWSATGGANTFNPPESFFPGASGNGVPAGGDGPQNVFIFGTPSSLRSAAPLAAAVAGATYTLTVSIGDQASANEPATVRAGFLFNDAFVPSGDTSFGAADYSPEGTFTDFTFSYTATAADAGKGLKIFLGESGGGAFSYDNVRLTVTPVPEPSAALLGLAAAGGMMLRRRRRT